MHIMWQESFWSEVEGAAQYDEGLKKKAESEPAKYAKRTWKDDHIEKVRHIWDWWRAKVPKFTFFFTAACLVALVPI